MFPVALFTIAAPWRQPKCPTEEWVQMWYICAVEYYSATKRNETGSFAEMRMDLESVIQSEVNQRENIV